MIPAPLSDSIRSRVFTALAGVTDPEIRKPITDLDMVSDVTVSETGQVTVGIRLTIAGCPAAQRIESDVLAATESVSGAGRASVEVAIMTREQRTALTEKLRGGQLERSVQFGPESLTRVYAITSGKGGVGKSTVTANLAVALAGEGLRVGIVDADVHGFSIPGLLGLVHDGLAVKPTQVGDMILPPIAHNVKVISIGMFIDNASAAVAWRGPMLHRTIKQFLTDVYFGDLDVLLLDLPPGTGDVAITVGQLLPHAEVIVVTTPQAAAADVAERSGIVARQTGQSVYGVIENMAAMMQPDGSLLELFGSGGGAEVARRLSIGQPAPVPVLAQVPLSLPLRTGGDVGLPVVLGAPDDPAARAILGLARSMKTRARGLAGLSLSLRPR
ncbi:Mrp/NBP35 family ATP-binding protein [Cryobacterium gelidum]|uniref:Iron-sulfur cluster carrier protein n=1 Tax=Cryobacterium gelidum TaxID=1259164 RepID=A0A4R9B0M7_9MICO|nr:Mrp/NBP35 family ATP-binding protein [Cryobacterium gelidum]TFD73818.1 MRP family ATP-binding protein [Cryobacterium gelidum]